MTDLPLGWATAHLGEVVEINPRSFDLPPDSQDFLSMVPMAALEAKSGKINPSGVIRFNDAKRRALTFFQENDVLFAKVSPCMENGKVALAQGLIDGRGVGSTEFFVLRSLGAIEPTYLMHYLLQDVVRADAGRSMGGAVGLRRVPRSYLAELRIPLPPLVEQRRIVAALEDLLTDLGVARLRLVALQNRASQLWSKVQELAVWGQLPGSRSGVLSAGFDQSDLLSSRKAAQGESSRAPAGPAGGLPGLPSTWLTASVDQACWRIEYGTSAKSEEAADRPQVPIIRMGNIQQGEIVMDSVKYLPASHPDLSSLILAEGDVLFNRTNSAELVGKSAAYDSKLGTASFASYLIRCRVVGAVDPEWLVLVINSSIGRRYVRSVLSQQVGQANVSGKKLAAMPIPIPPPGEQKAILEAVSTQKVALRRLSATVQIALRKAESLRQGILAEAFAGRLVPQDPNDEPAAELLARIRAERAVKVPQQRGRGRRTQKELPAPATRVTGDGFEQGALL